MTMVEKLKKRLADLEQQKNKSEDNSIVVKNRTIPTLKVVDDGTVKETSVYNFGITQHTTEFDEFLGNIVSVWAMPVFPGSDDRLNQILDHINKNKKDENTLIFFDNIHEGNVRGCVRGIYVIIKHLNLNPAKVYLFTGGLEAYKIHDAYCEKNNIVNKINIRTINVWEKITHCNKDSTKDYVYEIKEKEKLFLCFNRNARKHRVAILGLLYSKNLVEKSYYSFLPECYYKTLDDVLEWIEHLVSPVLFSEIKQSINLNKHKFPLVLNMKGYNENITYIKDTDEMYYRNSYFSLVTETFFFGDVNEYFDEASIFFTEKIFKPIICKHPFIQLNRPHSLEYLKKIGYKTFHPFIDERYDEIENDEDRLLAVVDEVVRLSQQTTEQWIEWQKNVAPIVEHNYNVIVNKTDTDYYFNE